MARDYKHAATSRNAPDGGTPGWLWLVTGVALGFVLGVGFNIGKDWLARPPEAQAEKTKSDAAPAKQQADTDKPQKPRFDFYKMLPNFEVVIPEQDKAVQRSGDIAEIETPGAYVLQAGSFREHADADRLKASLALLGIQSSIQEVTIDNAQTWHRVRIGPYTDLDKINDIRDRLQENGIPALVIRVGD